MMEKEYKYKFSIVMAVYNVEEYIAEAIDSLINQKNMNFEEDIQVILVNDGSPDNSEEVCLKYKNLYPNNIVYIKKENGGVSSARNKGLEFVEGKYVNFLDPDDKLDIRCLYKVEEFFKRNYKVIDLVVIPLFFFDAATGQHQLNRKFRGNRLINIIETPYYIQYSSSSAFIKSSEMKKYKFNNKLKYAEDAEVINKIILNKKVYGVLGGTKYYYRKRSDGMSAVDTSLNNREWYIDYFNGFSLEMIKTSIEEVGYILKYIQYLIMHDLQWRIKVESLKKDIFSLEEQEEIIDKIKEILQYIDDDVIANINMKDWYKIFSLELKYGKPASELLDVVKCEGEGCLYYRNTVFHKLRNSVLAVQNVDIDNNKLIIEGYTEVPLDSGKYEIIAEVNNEIYKSEKIRRRDKEIIALDQVILDRSGFKIVIPITDKDVVKLRIKIGDILIKPRIWIDKYVKLYSFMEKSYFIKEKYAVTYVYNTFTILRANLKTKLWLEYTFLKEVYKVKGKKEAIARSAGTLLKKIKTKPIWLFMDRVNKADDNAEHLFRYSVSKKDGVKKIFVIDKNSADYERMKEIGKVVSYGSFKHKLYVLLCSKIISSHSADFARNFYLDRGRILHNILDFKFVFLQHGITKDDVSVHLNKYNRAIDLFITAAPSEYESIINGDYFYLKDQVKLTGFPRYDNLCDVNKKKILIMPTWDKSIVNNKINKDGSRLYSDKFKKSKYFNIYNRLINDKRLINYANNKGYEIAFFPHPEINQQIVDFDRNEFVHLISLQQSYQKLINESSILVTDYSSIAFDFAYLKKPVIYFQWNENHYEKGYFDYDSMGFGEVVEDYNILVDTIVEYIENGCNMKKKYVDRVDSFYEYTDKNNCKRVYDEIMKL